MSLIDKIKARKPHAFICVSTIDCRSDIIALKRQVESLQRQNAEILNIIKLLGNEDGEENSFGKRLLLPVSS